MGNGQAADKAAERLDGDREKRRRRLTSRGRERKKQLMEAALALFGEKGYRAATVDDIARAAHTGKGTFYWYWASKEDLFHELVLEKFETYSEALTNVTRADLSAPEKLFLLVNGVSLLYGRYRQLCKLIFNLISDDSDDLHREVNVTARRYYTLFKETLVELIRQGQAEGAVVETLDPESLVTILISVFDGVMVQESILGEHYPTDKLGLTLLKVLKGGLFVS